jgi:hypothetical protein
MPQQSQLGNLQLGGAQLGSTSGGSTLTSKSINGQSYLLGTFTSTITGQSDIAANTVQTLSGAGSILHGTLNPTFLDDTWPPVSSSVIFTISSAESRGGYGHFADLFRHPIQYDVTETAPLPRKEVVNLNTDTYSKVTIASETQYSGQTPTPNSPVLTDTWTPVDASVVFTISSATSRGGYGHFADLFRHTIIGNASDGLVLKKTLFFYQPSTGGITTTQTITGQSDIQLSTTKTILGQSSIGSLTTKTITGQGDIQSTRTQTITGQGSIQITTTKTLTGQTSIGSLTTKTLTGQSVIAVTTTKTLTGQSDIQKTTTQTIQGYSDIGGIFVSTIQGTSDIKANTLQTILGAGDIITTTTHTITGQANVGNLTTQTINGESCVAKNTIQTIPGAADLENNTTKTITGQSDIGTLTVQTITGQSDLQNDTTKTITGAGDIQNSTIQTISGQTSVGLLTIQTILGIGVIQNSTTQSINGQSSITGVHFVTANLIGVSTLTGKVNLNQSGFITCNGETTVAITPFRQVNATFTCNGNTSVFISTSTDQFGTVIFLPDSELNCVGSFIFADGVTFPAASDVSLANTNFLLGPDYLFGIIANQTLFGSPDFASIFSGSFTMSGTTSSSAGGPNYLGCIDVEYVFGFNRSMETALNQPLEDNTRAEWDLLPLFVGEALNNTQISNSVGFTNSGIAAIGGDGVLGEEINDYVTFSILTHALLTQEVMEVLATGNPNVRVTAINYEMLWIPTSHCRNTQVVEEVLYLANLAAIQQAAIEGLGGGDGGEALLDQVAIEAIYSIKAFVLMTQATLEMLQGPGDPSGLTTQITMEVLTLNQLVEFSSAYIQQVAIASVCSGHPNAVVAQVAIEELYTNGGNSRLESVAIEGLGNGNSDAAIQEVALATLNNAAITPAGVNQIAIEMLVKPGFDGTVGSMINNPHYFL